MKNISYSAIQNIENCLNGNITVYEYTIQTSGLKLIDGNKTIELFTNDKIYVEGNVDYSKMTDEEIDEYDNKLYLSTPHDTIIINTVNKNEIIQKIKDCHTILFILVNDECIIDKFKLYKKSMQDMIIKINTTSNLNLFNKNEFVILTWTDFKKYNYI